MSSRSDFPMGSLFVLCRTCVCFTHSLPSCSPCPSLLPPSSSREGDNGARRMPSGVRRWRGTCTLTLPSLDRSIGPSPRERSPPRFSVRYAPSTPLGGRTLQNVVYRTAVRSWGRFRACRVFSVRRRPHADVLTAVELVFFFLFLDCLLCAPRQDVCVEACRSVPTLPKMRSTSISDKQALIPRCFVAFPLPVELASRVRGLATQIKAGLERQWGAWEVEVLERMADEAAKVCVCVRVRLRVKRISMCADRSARTGAAVETERREGNQRRVFSFVPEYSVYIPLLLR